MLIYSRLIRFEITIAFGMFVDGVEFTFGAGVFLKWYLNELFPDKGQLLVIVMLVMLLNRLIYKSMLTNNITLNV